MGNLFIYFHLYLSSSSFPQGVKYLKTKPMKKLKHFPSLKLILFWLLWSMWSLCFCFDTSVLEMMNGEKSMLESEGKEKINPGGQRQYH